MWVGFLRLKNCKLFGRDRDEGIKIKNQKAYYGNNSSNLTQPWLACWKQKHAVWDWTIKISAKKEEEEERREEGERITEFWFLAPARKLSWIPAAPLSASMAGAGTSNLALSCIFVVSHACSALVSFVFFRRKGSYDFWKPSCIHPSNPLWRDWIWVSCEGKASLTIINFSFASVGRTLSLVPSSLLLLPLRVYYCVQRNFPQCLAHRQKTVFIFRVKEELHCVCKMHNKTAEQKREREKPRTN